VFVPVVAEPPGTLAVTVFEFNLIETIIAMAIIITAIITDLIEVFDIPNSSGKSFTCI
jgi:hypothetical protein